MDNKMITAEAIRIADKYTDKPRTLSPIEEMRRLDRSSTAKAQIVSLCIGIAGTLIMGFGMSCALVWDMMIVGIIIGVIGIGILLTAYPIYKKIYTSKKKELAPRILELSRMITEEGIK